MKRILYLLSAILLLASCSDDPVACLEISHLEADLGEEFTVTNCSSNYDYAFVDFGDGTDSVSIDGSIISTYHKAGTYTITLYAHDSYGYKKIERDITIYNPAKSDILGKWKLSKEYDWFLDNETLHADPVTFDLQENDTYYKITEYGTSYQDSVLSYESPDRKDFSWAFNPSTVLVSLDINTRKQIPYLASYDNEQLYVFSYSATELVLVDKPVIVSMNWLSTDVYEIYYGYNTRYHFTKVE